VPSGDEPGVHPLVALEGHLVRMSLAGGAAKDPAPEKETVKDGAPTKSTTEAALTKSAKRRQRRKAKKPLQERRKATPRPPRPPRVDRPLSLGVREELRLATADLIRIRAEREQLRLELSALKAHCRATGVGEPRIPLPPVSHAGYGKMVSFWFSSTQYGRIMGAVCRHSDQGRPLWFALLALINLPIPLF